MALKVGNEWKEHGWWIKVDATQKPVLWIMSYTVVEERYWSAVGKSFGEILTISPSGSDDVLVTVSAEETFPSKIRLQRRLLFAPIPRICLEGEIVMRGLRSLQEFWLTMPLEVRSAREIALEKFSALSPKEVKRATMLHLEHSAYDDLRSRDATTSEGQRPSEPEETDPIYRVVAAPVVANWETPRSRAPRPQPTKATMEGALQSRVGEGVIERSVRRRVATGLQRTSSEHNHSGASPTPAGSTPGGSAVVRAARVALPSRNTVAITSTSVGTHHAESSRAGALRSSSTQSPTAHADVARATIPQRTSTHVVGGASSGQGLILAEGLNGEDLQVNADEEEEVDDGPGHIRNVLHKRRAGSKKKLKTLTNPPTKRKTREREGRGHPKPLKPNFLWRRSSRRDIFGDLHSSLTLPSTTSVLCSTWRQITAASLNGG
jgi:hypothetical protein